jgi:NAD+ synthase (glutamine-hydrolysing)
MVKKYCSFSWLKQYDCSSADINPIGSISKMDLRLFLKWAATNLGYPSLAEIEAAPPTAELEPIRSDYSQLDEVDMGMTYEELSVYGRMRKIFRCGPVSMFKV